MASDRSQSPAAHSSHSGSVSRGGSFANGDNSPLGSVDGDDADEDADLFGDEDEGEESKGDMYVVSAPV